MLFHSPVDASHHGHPWGRYYNGPVFTLKPHESHNIITTDRLFWVYFDLEGLLLQRLQRDYHRRYDF